MLGCTYFFPVVNLPLASTPIIALLLLAVGVWWGKKACLLHVDSLAIFSFLSAAQLRISRR